MVLRHSEGLLHTLPPLSQTALNTSRSNPSQAGFKDHTVLRGFKVFCPRSNWNGNQDDQKPPKTLRDTSKWITGLCGDSTTTRNQQRVREGMLESGFGLAYLIPGLHSVQILDVMHFLQISLHLLHMLESVTREKTTSGHIGTKEALGVLGGLVWGSEVSEGVQIWA